ncbi:MAG: hypothetical protein NWR72_18710, partial [Bacteroidia bacterium]|nr:hypothetical protein [Bacteroidia bacterium]
LDGAKEKYLPYQNGVIRYTSYFKGVYQGDTTVIPMQVYYQRSPDGKLENLQIHEILETYGRSRIFSGNELVVFSDIRQEYMVFFGENFHSNLNQY